MIDIGPSHRISLSPLPRLTLFVKRMFFQDRQDNIQQKSQQDDKPCRAVIRKIQRILIMILFQKIYKRLLILWMACFCFSTFSNPFIFDPMMFAPHPLPSQIILPQNTPLMPFCPQNMAIKLCLALTSFPMVEMNPNIAPSVTMFTPFAHKSQKISSNRRKRLLSKYKWKSYEYEEDEYTLKNISEEERNVEPEGDYYRVHIQETSEDNSPVQVIQEERANGQQQNSFGELRGIRTEEILRTVENPSIQTTERSLSPQTAKQETQKSTEEEKQVTQPTNLNNSAETIALNHNNIPKQCSDLRSGNTEAISICADCTRQTNDQLKRDSAETLGASNLNRTFNTNLLKKLEGKICHGSSIIEPIKNNLERTCGTISFEEYISDILVCESCKHEIPPAAMLAMMSLENDGKCFRSGDDKKSRGLFQINTTFHKDIGICSSQQKRQIQKSSLAQLKAGPQCLENPVINTKKSIEILKSSYKSVNGSKSAFSCQSPNMDTHQTNRWRKAIAGYNGGPGHVKRLKNMQKPEAISKKQWDKMNEWEKIRVQYFFYKKANPTVRMRNLAHVETALGSTGNSTNQMNLFNSWTKSLGNKIDQNQCQ